MPTNFINRLNANLLTAFEIVFYKQSIYQNDLILADILKQMCSDLFWILQSIWTKIILDALIIIIIIIIITIIIIIIIINIIIIIKIILNEHSKMFVCANLIQYLAVISSICQIKMIWL
jgi:hypothetical protein